MGTLKLSIIIPTYNRVQKLKHCLEKLEDQSLKKDLYDIWVVDDGSTDETRAYLKEWAKQARHCVLFQTNSGQGLARNFALQKITNELVLFIGDDIYTSHNFLETHYEFHQKKPEKNKACLGLTEWDPEHEVTPFMHWMTNGGYQFAYHKMKADHKVSFWNFYTSNISLKTELLKENIFSSAFKGYGWEDIELAYRLEKTERLQIIYTPKALAFHDHLLKEEDLEKKMQSLARNGEIFENLHPEIKVLPRGLKRFCFILLGSTPILYGIGVFKHLGFKRAQNFYWYALSKRYFHSKHIAVKMTP